MNLRENFWLGPMVHLDGAVRSTPVNRAGDLGLNPGPGENFSLKLIKLYGSKHPF